MLPHSALRLFAFQVISWFGLFLYTIIMMVRGAMERGVVCARVRKNLIIMAFKSIAIPKLVESVAVEQKIMSHSRKSGKGERERE